jgi:4-diphosphocytidyl-2-C-methyl-D-erythritol kinase
VIVVPGTGLSTAAVYRAFDALPAPPPDDGEPPPPAVAGLDSWCRNDLWPAARSLDPDLSRVHDVLSSAGAAPALLCGSGSAIAGITETTNEACVLAKRVAAALPATRVLRAGFPGA